jgi:hypothetical protein
MKKLRVWISDLSCIIQDDRGIGVAVVPGVLDRDKELANLFAAAPDLLEACEAWVEVFDDLMRTSDPDDPLTRLRFKFHHEREAMTRAAIAKAKATPEQPHESA